MSFLVLIINMDSDMEGWKKTGIDIYLFDSISFLLQVLFKIINQAQWKSFQFSLFLSFLSIVSYGISETSIQRREFQRHGGKSLGKSFSALSQGPMEFSDFTFRKAVTIIKPRTENSKLLFISTALLHYCQKI